MDFEVRVVRGKGRKEGRKESSGKRGSREMITNDVEDEGDLPGKLKEEKKEEFKHRQRRQSLGGQKAPMRPRRESTTSTGSWCECLYPLLHTPPHPVQYHASFQDRVPQSRPL